jgi:hypothetical protein
MNKRNRVFILILNPHPLLFPDHKHTIFYRAVLPLPAGRPLARRQPEHGVSLLLFLRIAPGTVTVHAMQLKTGIYCTVAGVVRI